MSEYINHQLKGFDDDCDFIKAILYFANRFCDLSGHTARITELSVKFCIEAFPRCKVQVLCFKYKV